VTAERRETWETLEIASLVIVHGGWGGGWEWTEVARSLRERGHDVFTPTLTGMGERAHLGHPQVGLSTHVEDVVAVLELEDLHKVVLCGHSYGGMPVTGAADRVIDRIGLVIYIDALVPRHGQSAFDLLPGLFRQLAQASADAQGDGWRVPIPASLLPQQAGSRTRNAPAMWHVYAINRWRPSPNLSTSPARSTAWAAPSSAAPAMNWATTSAATRSRARPHELAVRVGSTANSLLRTTHS
jgi:pimeloyl-ACP methyl ester carboxylesterase